MVKREISVPNKKMNAVRETLIATNTWYSYSGEISYTYYPTFFNASDFWQDSSINLNFLHVRPFNINYFWNQVFHIKYSTKCEREVEFKNLSKNPSESLRLHARNVGPLCISHISQWRISFSTRERFKPILRRRANASYTVKWKGETRKCAEDASSEW